MFELSIENGRYLMIKQSPTGQGLIMYTHRYGTLDAESLRDDIITAYDLMRYLKKTLTKLEKEYDHA